MTMGQRLLALRTRAGLSQEALAEQLGVSRQSISKWETDGSIPDLDKLVRLSEIFGVTLDELVKGVATSVPMSQSGTDSTTSPPSTAESSEILRQHRQKLAGLCILFCTVVLCLFHGGVYGLIFVWPLAICGVACLLCKRSLGLICGWGAWLYLFITLGSALLYFTGGTRFDQLFALIVAVPLGILTGCTIHHPPALPVCWLLLAVFLYQYRNMWFLLEPVTYINLFRFSQLPAGGILLTLYWIAMGLLLLVYTVRFVFHRKSHTSGAPHCNHSKKESAE